MSDIEASITVRPALTVITTVDKKEIPAMHYKDLISGNLHTLSQLINLMARIKAWCKDSDSRPVSLLLDTAVQCLEGHLQTIDAGTDEYCQLNFILQQI